MALTFPEIKERLKRLDEIDLLEVLGITSEDLVERFEDFIENKYDEIEIELTEEQAEDWTS